MESAVISALTGQPLIILLMAVVIYVQWNENRRKETMLTDMEARYRAELEKERTDNRDVVRKMLVAITRSNLVMQLVVQKLGVTVPATVDEEV